MALTDLTRISTSGIATGTSLSGAILHGDAHFRGTQVGVTSALFDSSDDALEFSDNVKLTFGDSGDLSIYHTGGNSIVRDQGTGTLSLQSNGTEIALYNYANSQYMGKFANAAQVELYYAGDPKFQTTSTGAIVTGILTATSFSGPLVGNTNNTSGLSTFYDLRVSNNLTVEGTTTTLDTNLIGVDRVEVGANSNTLAGIAVTQSGAADIVRLFDGSTQVVTVDDTGNVGLGSAIPSAKLDVVGNMKISGNIDANGDLDVDGLTNLDDGNVSGVVTFTSAPNAIQMNDGARVSFGTSLKTSISYDTGTSRTKIRNFNDTLEIGYRSTELHYINQARLTIAGSNIFSADANTTFTGANYHASWIPVSNMFRLNDNAKLAFGNQTDAEIYHNGGNFYIDNDTGHFYIRNNVAADVDKNIYIQAKSGENSISCGNDGEVVLFSNSISANQAKLQTTGHGVYVTGIGTFTDKLSVTGSQNSQLTNNQLTFDRAGYSYIDQLSDSGSLVFRVKANNTIALRLDSSAQSIFGASAHTIVGYGGTGHPYNNNSLSLYGTANIGLVGQYSSLNMPMDHSNANVGGNWWMLGRVHGTTNEWGLSSRPGNSNTLRRIWRVVNKSDNSGLLDYQSFHYNNGIEALRIDNGGRLMIGSDTTKTLGSGQYGILNVEGYAGASTLEAFMSISRGEVATTMSNNDEVGNITFNDKAGYEFARIQVAADNNTGTTDTPGRIVFKTTADGSTSATERLRIKSDGKIKFATNDSSTDYLEYGSNPRLWLKCPSGINGMRIDASTTPLEIKNSSNNGKSFSFDGNFNFNVNGDYSLSSGQYDSSGKIFLNATRHNGSTTVTSFQTSIQAVATSNANNTGYLGLGASASPDDFKILTSGEVSIGGFTPTAGAGILQIAGGLRVAGSASASDTTTPYIYRTSGVDNLNFATSGVERLSITSTGRLQHKSATGISYFNGSSEYIFGSTTSSPPAGGYESLLQVHTSKTRSAFTLAGYNSNAGGPFMTFLTSRSTTRGTLGSACGSADTLGEIRFTGDNGTNYNSVAIGARISAKSASAPGSGDTVIAGRLMFATGAATAASGSTNTVMELREDGELMLKRGRVNDNGSVLYCWGGYIAGTGTLSFDVPVLTSGNIYKIDMFYSHHSLAYGCYRYGVYGAYSGHPGVQINQDFGSHSSSNGGSWTITRGSAGSALNIAKTAGTYSGGGFYFVNVYAGNYTAL